MARDFQVLMNLTQHFRISKILRQNKRQYPPLHGERRLVYTIEDKLEALADSLEAQCTNNYKNIDLDHIDTVHRQVRGALSKNNITPIDHVEPEEIYNICRHLKTKKAAGPDLIKNQALKNLPRKNIVEITNIANACLKLHYFPTPWREAHVMTAQTRQRH